MRREFQLYDVVTVIQDIPEHKLVPGQVGTIVEQHNLDAFDVEFVDNSGYTYALTSLRREQLLLLHYEPEVVASGPFV